MITSQLPVAKWHECIGEPTIADAILDRLFEMPTESPWKESQSTKICKY